MKIPGPLLFGFFTLCHLWVAYGALQLVPATKMVAGSLFMIALVTVYDNLVIVTGKYIGVGNTARRLNRARFLLHAVCISLLIPVYVGIGAREGIELLGGETALNVTLSAAGLIALFGLVVQFRAVKHIFPINYYGCLRYAQSVDESRRWPGYEYTAEELAQKAFPPLASIITVFIGLILSLWIAVAVGFWVPFIVTALMFSASAFGNKPWGPLATSGIEVVYSFGLLYSIWESAIAHSHGHVH